MLTTMFTKYKNVEPKNILVVRSSSKLFPVVVDELRASFPDATIQCVLPTQEAKTAVSLPAEQVIITAQGKGFAWRDLKAFCRDVRARDIDLAVVLYNSKAGLRYLNADAFAIQSGAPVVLSVNINKEVRQLTRWAFVGKCLHRLWDSLWVVANVLLSAIVVVSIVVVMLMTAPVAWCKRVAQGSMSR